MKPKICICSIVLLVCLSPAAFAGLYWCPVCQGDTHHSDGHPHFRRGGRRTIHYGPTARQLAVRAYNLSTPYFNRKDWPQAIKHLKQSLAHDSNYGLAKYWLKKALEYQLRDWRAAAAKRARRQREANAQTAKQRGLEAARRGDLNQAVRHMEVALCYLPNDRDIKKKLKELRLKQIETDNFKTGMMYFNSGDWKRAVTYLHEAKRHNRNNQEYARRLKKAKAKLAQSLASSLESGLQNNSDSAIDFPDIGGEDDADIDFETLANTGRPKAGVASIEILMVPVISPRHYLRIDATTWPEKLKPKIELTNSVLAKMQDQAESAGKDAVNWVKLRLREKVGGHIPGYAFYCSARDDFKEMFELLGRDQIDLYHTNVNFVNRVVADSGSGSVGNRANYGEINQIHKNFKDKHDRKIGKRIKSDVKWSQGQDGSDEPSRVVPIEKAPLRRR